MSSEPNAIGVPFAVPAIGDDEIAEVVDTLRSGWLTTGPKTKRFEEEFANSVGVPHALATNSCTGALHLALRGLGVNDEHEVITSTMTFAATANVIVHCGARPVFVDVEPETLNLDVGQVEAALNERTRAVIAVHYAGRPCAIARLRDICRQRGVALVEDCAHAVGASIDGVAAGAWGDAGAFSFYANKNMTTGEGGMLTTHSQELVAKARVLRLQGMTRDVFGRTDSARPSWQYDIVEAGFKYSMSDIQAALGIHQLRRLASFQEARRRIVESYSRTLVDVPGLFLPPPQSAGMVHAWHLYVVQVDPKARQNRDSLFESLGKQAIHASVHFAPLHLHPYFRERFGYRAGQFPVAEQAFARILSLPLFSTMSDEQQERVVAALNQQLGA